MSSNWQYLPPMGIGQPGAPVRANGGGGTDVLTFRDPLDAKRSAFGGRLPSATYPDGYLGTITDRRQDRLKQAVKKRMNDRSYQRGVHAGDKVDPGDYRWPEAGGVRPTAGLEYEARGLKWTQRGTVAERLAHGGKVNALSPAEMAELQQKYGVADVMVDIDPARAERLKKLLPSASMHNSPDAWR